MEIHKHNILSAVASLMAVTICCTLTLVLIGTTAVQSAQLNVLYIEYPPYYSTTSAGDVDGIIVDIVRKVFERAGVQGNYTSLPSKRVLMAMQKGTPVASLGWFKTVEREKFAKFSLPVYLNKPVAVLMLHEDAHRFSKYTSFNNLMGSGLFKIGRIDGHSDGEYIDGLLLDHKEQIVWLASDQVRLVKMLKSKRFDFILIPPEEMEDLIKSAGFVLSDFSLQPMNDIPIGNARYIMYAKTIDDELVKQIDKAIVDEVGDLTPSH